jgi:hypothetical protein
MEIGIGLPGTVAGVTGAQILDWARRAEHRGFLPRGARSSRLPEL